MDGKLADDWLFDDFDVRLMSESKRKQLLEAWKKAEGDLKNAPKIEGLEKCIVYGTGNE